MERKKKALSTEGETQLRWEIVGLFFAFALMLTSSQRNAYIPAAVKAVFLDSRAGRDDLDGLRGRLPLF